MRFLITAAPDPAKPPAAMDGPIDEALFSRYMKFNEDLMKAGVLVASEGLNPAGRSAKVGVSGAQRKVLDGPFTESKELVGGFYLIDVASFEEALEWTLRCPVGFESESYSSPRRWDRR